MAKRVWKPGCVLYPVPAVMVTCGDFKNKKSMNIITIAWTGTANSEPPMVHISVRPERYSYNIIKEYGEFVVNLATEGLVFPMDYCGVKSGRDADKFEKTGLTPIASQVVAAPSIAESPVNIECETQKIIPLGTHDMFIGKIVSVSADEKYFDENGAFRFEDAAPVCYSHGNYYGLGKYIGKFGYSVEKKSVR